MAFNTKEVTPDNVFYWFCLYLKCDYKGLARFSFSLKPGAYIIVSTTSLQRNHLSVVLTLKRPAAFIHFF